MNGSTIAIIYGVVLVIFFILLVVLTVTLIVSKSKKHDDEDEVEEYEEYDLFDKGKKNKKEWYEEDSYSVDDSYVDSAFAEVDSAFVEPVQQVPTVEPVQPVVSVDKVPTLESVQATVPVQRVEAVQTEIPVVDSAFSDSAFAETAQEMYVEDSAFSIPTFDETFINDNINASVKEAEALSKAMVASKPYMESPKAPTNKKHTRSNVPSTDDFYWYNKMDVAEKPSYKTREMYYHHFNIAKDCIEELLMEMYDCALVRTEEIKYIAYGIEPRAVSMKEILTSGNRNYTTQARLKEPSTQDLVRIYEKWCGYVDRLFEKIHIHADDYTINEIRTLLYEFGRNDVDVLIEGM